MTRFLILCSLVMLLACKQEKTATVTPTASLAGELHYRKMCVTGVPSPVLATPSPLVFLTKNRQSAGAPSSVKDGRFLIQGIPATGSYELNVFSWGTALFYTQNGPAASLPAYIASLSASSAGVLCVDNDAPEIRRVIAHFPGAVTTYANAGAPLHLARNAGEIRLAPEGSDPDGQDITWQLTSSEGTLTSSDGTWFWNLSGVTAPTATLLVRADDGHGGQSSQAFEVSVHENLVLPAFSTANYDLAQSAARTALDKTQTNDAGRWTFSQCCLVAAQYDPAVATTLEAKSRTVFYWGVPFTAETSVEAYSVNSTLRFGLRITNAAERSNYFDFHLTNEGGINAWHVLTADGMSLGGDLYAPLQGGRFTLRFSYDPILSLASFDVRQADGSVTGTTISIPGFAAAATYTASLRMETIATNYTGNTYLGIPSFSVSGGLAGVSKMPATPGVFNGIAYSNGLYGEEKAVYATTAAGEFAGADWIDMPLTTGLLRALVTTAEGKRITVLSDSEPRLLAWLPQGSTVDRLDSEAVVATTNPYVYLY